MSMPGCLLANAGIKTVSHNALSSTRQVSITSVPAFAQLANDSRQSKTVLRIGFKKRSLKNIFIAHNYKLQDGADASIAINVMPM
jgi:hypothetical protein